MRPSPDTCGPAKPFRLGGLLDAAPRPFPEALSLRFPERTFRHHEMRFTHALASSGESLWDRMVATRQARPSTSWGNTEPHSRMTVSEGTVPAGAAAGWAFVLGIFNDRCASGPLPYSCSSPCDPDRSLNGEPFRQMCAFEVNTVAQRLTPPGDTHRIREGSASLLLPLESKQTLEW